MMTTDGKDWSIDGQLKRLICMLSKTQKQKLLAYGETLVKERRRAQRKKYVTEVSYADTHRTGCGFVQNISLFGLYIEPDGIMEAGRSITLAFAHPARGRQIKITGMIVRKDRYGFAVKFDKSIGPL